MEMYDDKTGRFQWLINWVSPSSIFNQLLWLIAGLYGVASSCSIPKIGAF
jgi:hypothetical protein